MLSIEQLKEINKFYPYKHDITETETEKANGIIQAIELATKTDKPQPGDKVLYTTKYGDFYANATIEKVNGQEFYICENGSFWAGVKENGDHYVSCGAGGSFSWLPIEQLQPTQKTTEAVFKTWGRFGAEADGAFCFKASVKVWIFTEKNIYKPYTTEKYNKYYVHRNDDPEVKYMFKTSNAAWKNYQEFNVWLLKNKAVIFKHFNNNYVVFTYKKESILLSETAWQNCENYTEKGLLLINCSHVPVKRKINDSQKLITEYRYSNRNNDETLEQYRENLKNNKYMNDKRNTSDRICVDILEPLEV